MVEEEAVQLNLDCEVVGEATVLVVEDNYFCQFALAQILRSNGIAFEKAWDG